MAPDLDPLTEWLALGCWLAFAVTWVAGWVYNLLRAPKVWRRSFSPTIVFGAVAAWFLSSLVPQRFWDAITIDQWFLRDAGLALLVAGTAFAIWARIVLGTMWSGVPSQRDGHQLRTDGPFAVTRHPIYTGVLAMLLGTAFVFGVGSWAGPVVAGAIALGLKIRVEEKLLLETFGSKYEAYRSRVPALIPLPQGRQSVDA